MFKLRPARKPAFTDTDIEQYIDALSQPGALTAALNYYRANFTMANARRFARSPALSMETLIIWGELDPALGIELLEGLDQVAPYSRAHRLRDASHWVQNEAPKEVNQVLIDFLRS